jgi:hypothetical protein
MAPQWSTAAPVGSIAGRRSATVPGVNGPNRADRLARILERDGSRCVWCGRQIDTDLVRATTEHVVPRIKGGPSWIENEVAACARCNHRRGNTTPAEWLDHCDREPGWEPDRVVIIRTLEALLATIGARGGQRRARAYAESQLRRLTR